LTRLNLLLLGPMIAFRNVGHLIAGYYRRSEQDLGGFPALSAAVGQFLLKDVVLLGAATWSLGELCIKKVEFRSSTA
jgi:hypothetical protein